MFEGFDGWLRIKDDNSGSFGSEPSSSGEFEAEKPYSVSQFLDEANFRLERNFSDILVEGEVVSFKVNQGKWVFFDLKDEASSINCFLPVFRLSVALKDGMKIRVRATPKLTRWGKFSLTVQQIVPIGKGSIKKSFELLKQKLAKEGLFAPQRKRPLPAQIQKIGVISSATAAGYRDFLKILNERWGGLRIFTAYTQVQGLAAPEQILRALDFLNQRSDLDAIAIIRGGGSADDLAAFNDERLARAIARSKTPIITGIGHEIDETLADLAADVRASTPSNAAERVTRDRRAVRDLTQSNLAQIGRQIGVRIALAERQLGQRSYDARRQIFERIEMTERDLRSKIKILDSLDPNNALRRGYAIITKEYQDDSQTPSSFQKANQLRSGDEFKVVTDQQIIIAEAKDVKNRPR